MSQVQQWDGNVRATFGTSAFENVHASIWISTPDEWGGSLLIRSAEPQFRLEGQRATLDFGWPGTRAIEVQQVIPLASLGSTAATVVRFRGSARLEDRFNAIFGKE